VENTFVCEFGARKNVEILLVVCFVLCYFALTGSTIVVCRMKKLIAKRIHYCKQTESKQHSQTIQNTISNVQVWLHILCEIVFPRLYITQGVLKIANVAQKTQNTMSNV